MRKVIQWGLVGMLFIFMATGIVISVLGAVNDNPQQANIVMIISGTLMVAVSSFCLTLLAKVLG